MITRGGSGLATGNDPIPAAGSAREGIVGSIGVRILSGNDGLTGCARRNWSTSRGSARRSCGAAILTRPICGSAGCGKGKIPSGTGRCVISPLGG